MDTHSSCQMSDRVNCHRTSPHLSPASRMPVEFSGAGLGGLVTIIVRLHGAILLDMPGSDKHHPADASKLPIECLIDDVVIESVEDGHAPAVFRKQNGFTRIQQGVLEVITASRSCNLAKRRYQYSDGDEPPTNTLYGPSWGARGVGLCFHCGGLPIGTMFPQAVLHRKLQPLLQRTRGRSSLVISCSLT